MEKMCAKYLDIFQIFRNEKSLSEDTLRARVKFPRGMITVDEKDWWSSSTGSWWDTGEMFPGSPSGGQRGVPMVKG